MKDIIIMCVEALLGLCIALMMVYALCGCTDPGTLAATGLNCGSMPQVPEVQPGTRTVDPVYGPLVIEFARDYDASQAYEHALLAFTECTLNKEN